MNPTAQIINDFDGWYLRWQDGDLYWVTIDLEAISEGAALLEAREWLDRNTHLEMA